MSDKKVYGIGINDARSSIRSRESGWVCPYYKMWSRTIAKAAKETNGRHEYRIDREWIRFSVFRDWVKKEGGEHRVLIASGKTYSPNTSAFFSRENANAINHKRFHAVKPESKREEKVLAQLAKDQSKRIRLFDSPLYRGQYRGENAMPKNKETQAIIKALKKCIHKPERRVTEPESDYKKRRGVTISAIHKQLIKNPNYAHISETVVRNRIERLVVEGVIYPPEKISHRKTYFPVGFLRVINRNR